jgi:hypothetical protein
MTPLTGLLLAAEFLAGTSRVEITPPPGHAMAGYDARKGVGTRKHDPLYATVLVLKTPETGIALITLDLRAANSARVDAEVMKRFRIANTLLAASHTHSGPDQREDDPWWIDAQNKMIDAVGEAVRNLAPARIGAGTGQVYLGHNRRRVRPDGSVEMLWRNSQKIPTSPVDPTITMLRIDDAAGEPRAILVNYACHPTVLGPLNLEYSSDYVGAMRETLERQFPSARVLFTIGGAGDINPYLDKQPPDENPWQAVKETGETLGAAAAKIVPRIATRVPNRMQFTAKAHTFDHRFEAGKNVDVALGVGLIDEIGIVTLSGEPFVDHQIRLRDRSDCRTTLLFGLTSTKGVGNVRYLPTIRAASEGGYGGDSATLVEPGAGEILIDRAIVQLLKFMGRLKPVPDLRY